MYISIKEQILYDQLVLAQAKRVKKLLNRESKMNVREQELRLSKYKKCGANMGPHYYIPITWIKSTSAEHVTHLMCRVCFQKIDLKTIAELFPETI